MAIRLRDVHCEVDAVVSSPCAPSRTNHLKRTEALGGGAQSSPQPMGGDVSQPTGESAGDDSWGAGNDDAYQPVGDTIGDDPGDAGTDDDWGMDDDAFGGEDPPDYEPLFGDD